MAGLTYIGEIKMSRPLVVAYHNNRLVLSTNWGDCVEFRTRAEFDGQVWRHEALVYQKDDVWYMLASSRVDGKPESEITFDAEAFLTARGAVKHAITRITTMRGHLRG